MATEKRAVPAGYRSVARVVADQLCHSCGVCGAVCFRRAITFDGRALPLVDEGCCNGCGLCLQVCSGWQGQAGRRKECGEEQEFLSASLDPLVRQRSSSGGLVTEILRTLLQTGRIKAALVTIADPANPARPKATLVHSEEELLNSSGSRYCLHPWGRPLADLIRRGEPYAVVGTSCQLSSLEYCLRFFPKLRKNLVLRIGICCESNIEPQATDHLLAIRHQSLTELQRIDYRYGDWPGAMAAIRRDGESVILSNKNRLEGAINYLKLCYGRSRCRFCSDILCEVADITIGDPWGRDKCGRLVYRGSSGWSAALSRSAEVATLLEEMAAGDRIELVKADRDGEFLGVQRKQDQQGLKQLGRQLVQAQKMHRAVPELGRFACSLSRGLKFTERIRERIEELAHREPLRTVFMRFFFSFAGDVLTRLNVHRRQLTSRIRSHNPEK